MILNYLPAQMMKGAFTAGSTGAIVGFVTAPFICGWETIQMIAFHAIFSNLSSNWSSIGFRASICLVTMPVVSIIAFGAFGAVIGLSFDIYQMGKGISKKLIQ